MSTNLSKQPIKHTTEYTNEYITEPITEYTNESTSERKTEHINFNERLLFAMIQRDYTNLKLAEAIHVTPAAVSAYKKGHRRPNFEQLRDIALTLNVSVNYLLGLSDFTSLY